MKCEWKVQKHLVGEKEHNYAKMEKVSELGWMGKGYGFQGSTGALQVLKREPKHIPPRDALPIPDTSEHLLGNTISLLWK